MLTRTHKFMTGLLLLAVACSPESTTPVDERGTPQHVTGPFVVSGAITGPGGASICSLVAGQVRVRLYLPTGSFAGSQNICPASNTYTLSVPGATYYLQVALPFNLSLGSKVLRSLDPIPLDVTADMVRDFQVEDGIPLGGGMTLDGLPVNGGGSIFVYHGELQNVLSTSGSTLPSGAWSEAFPRSAMYLQNGASYRFVYNCQMLAADLATPPPAGPLVFPTQSSSVSCDFTSNAASSRTHFNNRLVVTADAGDFGAQAPAQAAQRGRGWGVQFPVGASGPVHAPITAKQLYMGGLLFGFASGKELSTIDMTGYGICSPACAEDFDVSAPPSISPGSVGKVIRWRYTDASSPEMEGLEVGQWSYDATGDYVLFHFVVRNTTRQSKTLWAGVFMDWDLGATSIDDQVWTDWGGAFMRTNDPVVGSHFGTVLIGRPVSGNYAYGSGPACGGEANSSQRVAALMGTLRATEVLANNCDKRYIHGVGPITLPPGYQASFGVALVAGDNLAGLQATALAASGDYMYNLGHGGGAMIIDIHPGSTSNPVNARSGGLIPVAILGGRNFDVYDVTQIDVSRLVFGPGGASEAHNLNDPAVLADHLRDVNADGTTDLVAHFWTQETGLTAGATQACVNGVTLSGTVFDGCDVVNVK